MSILIDAVNAVDWKPLVDKRFRLTKFQLNPSTGEYVAHLDYPVKNADGKMATHDIVLDPRDLHRMTLEQFAENVEMRITLANDALLEYIGEPA